MTRKVNKGKPYTMKILITGGAGFIGSHLSRLLLDQEHEVRVLDNYSTGTTANNAPLYDRDNFHAFGGDIRMKEHIDTVIKGVDAVVHLAAMGSVGASFANPIEANSINVDGFLNVLHSAHLNDVSKVVYASSAAVYGDYHAQVSTMLDVATEPHIGKPMSPYAVTKRVNELYGEVFSRNYGVDCVGLRFFNVYGERQTLASGYAAVIPIFIQNILDGQPLTIYGQGDATRDFIYVGDVVKGIEQTLLAKGGSGIYNIGGGNSFSIRSLAKALLEIAGEFIDPANINHEINYEPERVGDIKHSSASIYKVSHMFNFHPTTSFEDGLRKTFKYYFAEHTKKK